MSTSPDDTGSFNTPLVEIRLITEIKTAKGVGGVKYGKWTAELMFGDERKEISATDEHQTIHTRGAVLAAVDALAALKRRCAVQLTTDSEYLLSGATTWLPMGMALGWNTGPKAARIRNHDLWGQLRALAARHDVHWIGPRNKGEFADTMTDIKTELWRRTHGDGPDIGYLYAGNVLPWDDSLGAYRAFTEDEKSSDVSVNVGTPVDSAATPLTTKEREARKRVIARIAKHYRPEHIHPAPPKPSPPPATKATPITLGPTKVRQLFAGFETVDLLRYPRADRRFKHQTERTAELEIGIEQ